MLRREYCSAIGSVSVLLGFQSYPRQSQVIEVGLYVTERALSEGSMSNLRELQESLQTWFSGSFDTDNVDVRIRILDVIQTPLRTCESTEIALSWWQEYSPVASEHSDCKLLLFSKDVVDWDELDGRAVIGGRCAVASGINKIDNVNNKRLAFHEILHCFGLRHEDKERITGDTYTIMHPHMYSNTQVLSTHSLRTLRGNL